MAEADAAQARHNVMWEWVKGHAGHQKNNALMHWRAGMELINRNSEFAADPTSNIRLQIVQMLKLRHAQRRANSCAIHNMAQHNAPLVLRTAQYRASTMSHHATRQIQYLRFARP